jgi:hypothetical protein
MTKFSTMEHPKFSEEYKQRAKEYKRKKTNERCIKFYHNNKEKIAEKKHNSYLFKKQAEIFRHILIHPELR